MKESKKKLISLVGTTSATVAIAIGVTFSWMSNNKAADARNINVSVVTSNELAISLNATNYVHDLSDNYNNDSFGQVSGDGATFYTYVAGLDSSNACYISGYREVDLEELESSIYYRTVYFKTDHPTKLFFDTNSFVSPASLTTRKRYLIPRDYIAGAMRVGLAIVDENEVAHPFFVWAPNSEYEYTASPRNFTPTGTVESTYNIINGTSLSSVCQIQTNGATFGSETINEEDYVLPKFMWGSPTQKELLTILPSGVTKMIFTIWLEGTDRECCDILSGGHINARLFLTSEAVYEEITE